MKNFRPILISVTLLSFTTFSTAAPNCSNAQIAITNADWFSEDQIIDIEVANAGSETLKGFEFTTGDGNIDYKEESSHTINPGEKEAFLMGNVWETPTEDLEVQSKECSNVDSATNIVYNQNSEFEARQVNSYSPMNVNLKKREIPLEMNILTEQMTKSNPIEIESNREAKLYVNGDLEGEGKKFTIQREAGKYELKLNKSNQVEELTELNYKPAKKEIEILNRKEVDLKLQTQKESIKQYDTFTLTLGPESAGPVNLYKEGEKIRKGKEFELSEEKPGEYKYTIRKNQTIKNGTSYTYNSDSVTLDVEEASIFSKAANFLGNLF